MNNPAERLLSDPPDIINVNTYLVRFAGPLVHETHLLSEAFIPDKGDFVRLPDGRHMQVSRRIFDFSKADTVTVSVMLAE